MNKGVYALIFRNRSCFLRIGSLGGIRLKGGWHIYVGSARGPGGFARVRRHRHLALFRDRPPRWHVDHLLVSPCFTLRHLVCGPSGDDLECALAGALGGEEVPSFGSSDCSCGSHLFHRRTDPLKEVTGAMASLGLVPGITTIKRKEGEEERMQVVGISGSMRKDGNTARLVRLILDRVKEAGIKAQYITLADKVIKPCIGCENCKEERSCIIKNDDWHRIIDKVLACEVLVLGAPTYYYDINGQTKNFIDRTYSLYHDRRLAGRRAVGVAVYADKGGRRALQTMEGFFSSHEFSYLGQVLGKGYLAGEVLEDKAAVQAAGRIGQKIVDLLRPQD